MRNKLTTRQKAFLYFVKRCGIYTAWAANRKRYFELNSSYFLELGDKTSLDFINRSNTVGDVLMHSFCWDETTLPFHQRNKNVNFWSSSTTMNSGVILLHFKENKALFDCYIDNFKQRLNELVKNERD